MRFNHILAALLGMLGAIPGVALAAEPSWTIVKIDNRDYVTVDNIAQFYDLAGNPRMVDRHIFLGGEHARLEFGNNPREVFINGVKQWLSFPAVARDGQILISRFDLAETIEPCLRPTFIGNLRAFHTVVLDAGHGGNDRGAGNSSGAEKDYTLDVIRDLRKALEAKGLNVMLTRDGDQYIPLESRAEIANHVPDAVFVSVHFNSSNDGGRANGFEVFAMTPRGAASTSDTSVSLEQFAAMPGNDNDSASLALATCVHHSLLGHIPEVDRGVKRARFAVLRLTDAPAILVEGGFLTNAADGRSINDSVWRQKLADSIAQGVQSFGELAAYKRPPKLLADYRSEQLPLMGTIINPALLAANPAVSAPSAILPVSNQNSSPEKQAGLAGAGATSH